jgi:hypothetical protein
MNRYEGIERVAAQIRSDYKTDEYEIVLSSYQRPNLIIIDRWFALQSDDDLRCMVTKSGDVARLRHLSADAPPNTSGLINDLSSALA